MVQKLEDCPRKNRGKIEFTKITFFTDTRDDFKRCLELQRFLNKITSHPDLVKSSLLRDFLCEEDEEKFKQIRKQIDESQKTIEVGQIEVHNLFKKNSELIPTENSTFFDFF